MSLHEWSSREFLRRLVRATVVGAIAYLLSYYVPLSLMPVGGIPAEYVPTFDYFVAITVVFSALMEFFTGTVIYYAVGAARVFVVTMLFVYTMRGGVLEFSFVEEEDVIHFVIDISPLLAILVYMSLLDIARYVLQAISFMVELEELRG